MVAFKVLAVMKFDVTLIVRAVIRTKTCAS